MRKPHLQSADPVVAIVLFLYTAILFASTFSMRTMALATLGPAFVPRIISIGLAVLSVVLFVNTIRKKAPVPLAETATAEDHELKETTGFVRKYSALLSIGLIFLYILSLKQLGFILSSSAYLFFQIYLSYGKAPRKKVMFFLGLSIVIATTIYLVFVFGLSLNLPIGILG